MLWSWICQPTECNGGHVRAYPLNRPFDAILSPSFGGGDKSGLSYFYTLIAKKFVGKGILTAGGKFTTCEDVRPPPEWGELSRGVLPGPYLAPPLIVKDNPHESYGRAYRHDNDIYWRLLWWCRCFGSLD